MSAIVVVFDVVARDLQIADFRAFDANAAFTVVTDVIAGNVDLMQINVVEKNTESIVFVDLTL